MRVHDWFIAALTSLVGACAMDFGPFRDYLACDASGACADGYTCAQTSLGAVCLDAEQWALRCGDVEICDGADNDCDGVTDDGFEGLGAPCSVGRGACARTGVTLCGDDGSATRCSAESAAAIVEICDGTDNDCDGDTDEDLGERRFGFATGTCQEEIVTCVDGVEEVIQDAQHPKNESCDGEDNDCDGATDEDFAELHAECAVDQGTCYATGVMVCDAHGDRPTCSAQPGVPTVDLCDGLDNNCDGATDERFVEEKGAACSVGLGPCRRDGVRECSADGFSTECNVVAGEGSPEVCDGEDNDCDGMPDDGLGDACCHPGDSRYCSTAIGACTVGEQRCGEDRAWDACTGVAPTDEVCDTVDNDCDGERDEGIVDCCQPGTTTSCSTDEGLCTVGEQRCGEDQRWAACTGVLPAPDFCDGLDNDCNGATDELYAERLGISCSEGIGPCRADAVTICTADGFGVMCGAVPGDPSPEVCDGVDNDCNGERDDGLGEACCATGATRVCSADVGICTSGTQRCGDRAWGACTGTLPADETCDGEDNDCDGVADEGILDCCASGTRVSCSTDEGTCTAGEQWCDLSRAWGLCSGILAEPDLCDGLDNNCDGDTDERFDCVGDFCSAGLGACLRTGIARCAEDGLGCACSVVAGPSTVETCDGADNDCDGFTDEPWDAVIGDACSRGAGACTAFGAMACASDGNGVVCTAPVIASSDEICDDADNDCDGDTDEGVGDCCNMDDVRPCGFTEGECRAGVQVCGADRVWGTCSGVFASDEACDGADNDCDGDTDEPWSLLLGELCSVGRGACEVFSAYACSGATSIACDAVADAATDEVCDGEDNDCDGDTDEAVDLSAPVSGTDEGACEPRIALCVDGEDIVLQYGVEPIDEVCDGADNDCDGDTDEDFDSLGDPCTVGEGACARSGVSVCVSETEIACSVAPGDATDERCDGVDNDCNGETDEAFPTLEDLCTVGDGPCAVSGTLICAAGGAGVACSARAGSGGLERCDGVDNDCDGHTDEPWDTSLGQPCTVGVGACARTDVWACAADGSAAVCPVVAGDSSPEICDGVDNDCDGVPDDHVPLTACYIGPSGTQGVGECRTGVTLCVDGVSSCVGAVYPSAEACNGLDEDCDGEPDVTVDGNGDHYPLTQPCYSGSPETLGVGECRNGFQACTPYIGPAAGVPISAYPVTCSIEPDICRTAWWSACIGETLQESEVCGDTLDTDCDGRDDGMTFLENFEDDCAMPEATVVSDITPDCVATPEDPVDPTRTPTGERSLHVALLQDVGDVMAEYTWSFTTCMPAASGSAAIFLATAEQLVQVRANPTFNGETTLFVYRPNGNDDVQVTRNDSSVTYEDVTVTIERGVWHVLSWRFAGDGTMTYALDGVPFFSMTLDTSATGVQYFFGRFSPESAAEVYLDDVMFMSP